MVEKIAEQMATFMHVHQAPRQPRLRRASYDHSGMPAEGPGGKRRLSALPSGDEEADRGGERQCCEPQR